MYAPHLFVDDMQRTTANGESTASLEDGVGIHTGQREAIAGTRETIKLKQTWEEG